MIVRRLAIALVLVAGPAGAHDRTTSYSAWDIHGREALVTVGLAALDVSRFPWANGPDREAALGVYVARHLQLVAGENPCAATAGPRALSAPAGRVIYEWRLGCPAAGELGIRSDLLLEMAPGHLHFARVTRDGAAPAERVLSEREPTWVLDAAPGASTSASLAACPPESCRPRKPAIEAVGGWSSRIQRKGVRSLPSRFRKMRLSAATTVRCSR